MAQNPATLFQSGTGRSPIWFPDTRESPFAIGIGCIAIGTVTYNIEHFFDDPNENFFIAAAAVASGQAIIPVTPPGINVSKVFVGQPVTDLTTPAAIPGSTTILSRTTAAITMSANAASGGILSGDQIALVTWFTNSGINAQTGNANGNYAFPVAGISLNITAGTGSVIARLIQTTRGYG